MRRRILMRIGIASVAAVLAVGAQPLLGASSASAADTGPAYYPSGPQVNVPVATVTSGGWTQCYLDKYSNHLGPALTGLLQACTGNYLMLAGRLTGSSTLSLLAAAPRADVLFDAQKSNTTHLANGSQWYFDAWSWGFANQGDAVARRTCDTMVGPLRLCWHTSDDGGYRIGDTIGLNLSDQYERIVYETGAQSIQFTSSAPPAPVPGDTYAVAATGGASGNAVVFSIDAASSGVCSIAGSTVTFDHPGDCTIDANQAGNGDYGAAAQVQQVITVGKIQQAVTFTSAVPTAPVPGGTYAVTTSGGASGSPVVLTVDAASGGVCSIAGSTVTFDHPGDCTIDANQAGNGDYGAAAQVQQVITVGKIQQAVTFTTSSPSGAVVGSNYVVVAGGGASGSPVVLTVDAASGGVCSIAGSTVTFDHPGDCTIDANQAGNTDYAMAPAVAQHVAVSQAATSTGVTVLPGEIVARVAVTAPGAGTPTGSMDFTVGTTQVGSAPVVDGTAALSYSVPAGATRTVSARYSGDRDFVASSASTARNDPRITATVSSARSKTRAGWYRSPVTVTYRCDTNGAPLAGACPAPVTLSTDGAGQSATGTVAATDGGVATVSVTGINIDSAKPRVRIAGVRAGATYVGKTPIPRCVAVDRLSGIASCRLTHRIVGQHTRWKAVATDRAGNIRKKTVTYTALPIYLEGARHSGAVFSVRAGRAYTLVVTGSAARPVYYDAALSPHRPVQRDKAFLPAGHRRWALAVTMSPNMRPHSSWNLGVKIGGTMHLVRVRLS